MGNSADKDPPADAELEQTVLKDLATKLNEFRTDGIFCDVMLLVDDKVFRAHRNILAASSPYFKAMFTGNFAEAGERKINLLRGVNSDMMPTILDFIYTGHIELKEDIVKELFQSAHHLQVLALVDACYLFLEKNIAVHNCVVTYGFADTYANDHLKKTAENFILKNFPVVSKTDRFLELRSEDLIRIIKEDSLAVDNEDVVCEAVFRWLHSEEQVRQPDFAEILKNVRLTFVSTDLLHQIDEKEDIVKISTECIRLVKQALFNKLQEKKEKPRESYVDTQKK